MLSLSKAPALCLFITATVEEVGEAAGDIIHFSLLGGNIAVTVNVKGCEEVAMSCVVLYLLHRERSIIGEKTNTGVPECMEPDMRKPIFIKQLWEMRSDAVRSYKRTDSINAKEVLVCVSLTDHIILLRFKSFKVFMECIVENEAPFAALGFQKRLEDNILGLTTFSVTDDLISILRKYTGIPNDHTLLYVQEPVIKIDIIPGYTNYLRTPQSQNHSENNGSFYV